MPDETRALTEAVTDEMIENFMAAMVGPDIAASSGHAVVVRGDIRTGLEAVLLGKWPWHRKPPFPLAGRRALARATGEG